jgi:hypothetical protein
MLAALVLAAVVVADVATPPPTALSKRGFDTDLPTAVRAIAFRPFMPDRPVTEVALLPPFHGEDVSRNEGVGLAYRRAGRAWLLQEWPRNGGSLADFGRLTSFQGCADVHAVGGNEKPRGVVWTTPRGLVLSLTPDGSAEPPVIEAEFRRLVERGGCR